MSSRYEHVRSETLREEVWHATLPSGLRATFCPKPGFKKRYATYATHYGSVDSEIVSDDGSGCAVPDGVAHFLEHCLFETERGNVSDLFSLNGAEDNASTSFTTTTYLFAASDRFYENLQLLVEFVETPSFRAEKVDKERGIIEQEIRGYEDVPHWVSYTGLLEGLFAKHPIRIDIAGTVESIQPIDPSTLQRCYDAFYRPENMHVFVVGDLDRDELFEFLARVSRPRTQGGVRERRYPRETADVFRRQKTVEMDVAQPKLSLGFKDVDVPERGREHVRHELASRMALELFVGGASDAYQSLYERGLIQEDFGSQYSSGAGIGYAMLGGDTPDPAALESELLELAARARRGSLAVEDFERGKRKFVGGFVRGFNSLEYIANYYTGYHFLGFDLFETVDVLEQITQDEVEARLEELLDPARAASFVVRPRS